MQFGRLSIEEGLSQTSAFSIMQTNDGFLWVGTKEGLNRYDGYSFEHYRHHPDIPQSISGNYILSMLEDQQGFLWIGTYGNGLNRYDPQTGIFKTFRHHSKQPNSLSHNHVRSLLEDRSGNLWVGTQSGLNRLNPETGTFQHFRHKPNDPQSVGGDFILSLYEDAEGMIWIGTFAGGLSRFNPKTGQFKTYRHRNDDARSLSQGAVYSILEDRQGILWVGTFGGGLCRFDRSKEWFRTYTHNEADPMSLSHDHVYALCEDQDGNLWVGTNGGGICRYRRDTDDFDAYLSDSSDPFSLSNNHVLSVYEDRAGILWIGTFGGGLNRYDKHSGAFISYRAGNVEGSNLNYPNVWALEEDYDGSLWVGTNGGGLNHYQRDLKQFRTFRANEQDASSLSDDRVLVLHRDTLNNLWVGTFGGGLNRFDRKTESFKQYRAAAEQPNSLPVDIVFSLGEGPGGVMWVGTEGGGVCRYDAELDGFVCYSHDEANPNSLGHNSVFAVDQDSNGTLWVGTFGAGLDRLDPGASSFVHLRHDAQDPHSLSNNRVYAIEEDREGNIWVGTAGGLNRYLPETQNFKVWRAASGLPNDVIYAICEDHRGTLWLNTNRGISHMNPQTETFENFDAGDGLLSDELNQNASLVVSSGEIFVGGVNGFNSFFPEEVTPSDFIPPVRITQLRIANQTVQPSYLQADSPLSQSVERTRQIVLDHTQRMFSLEFTALDFSVPGKNKYAYQLQGYNQDWIETDASSRRATYTNLAAGTYEFCVKGSNHDGIWNVEGARLKVVIQPPIWWSTKAKVTYVLLILAIIWWSWRVFRERLKREQRYAQQQHELAVQSEEMAKNADRVAARLRELDKLKDEFLANTSHELRTPLHGIIGLAESLRDDHEGELGPKARHTLTMIAASGKRLNNLVNDILDFSKMKNMDLVLDENQVDLTAVIDVVCHLSQPLLRGKDVVLHNRVAPETSCVLGDESRLQQILHNLVGNAIKFTHRGEISIEAKEEGGRLFVSVRDTGIGIPAEKLAHIFDSFSQVDASSSRRFSGTGLGLAVTRKLVELHHGTLSVDSQIGKGSTFTFSLTVCPNDAAIGPEKVQPLSVLVAQQPDHVVAPDLSQDDPETHGPTILIVDDEPVNRQVLLNHLGKRGYRLLEAGDGEEALAILKDMHVDLVLLDVMMPNMSGYEVCGQLRQTYSVQEMPVIFLTARARGIDIVEGFQMGGNDYLVKPIDRGELLSRVKTHLQLLELTRDLEQKVSERTLALREKNQELDSKYRELETLDHIVKAINREVEFTSVINTIMEGGKTLLPETEKSCFLIFDKEDQVFRFRAAMGYEMASLQEVTLTPEDAAGRFIDDEDRIADGIYHCQDPSQKKGLEALAHLPVPKTMVVLYLHVEGKAAGILVFDNLSDHHAFDDLDSNAASRFREHAISALVKAITLREMLTAQQNLLVASRRAGMAEIAASVQHNIGNILSSALTSVHALSEGLGKDDRRIDLFRKTLQLLPDQREGLVAFFNTDHRAEDVPKAMNKVGASLARNREKMAAETSSLEEHLQNISANLHEQRKMARLLVIEKAADLNQLVRQTLDEHSFMLNRMGINLTTQYGEIPQLRIDTSRFKRSLFYLLENAWEAIGNQDGKGAIHIDTSCDQYGISVRIKDNGCGLPPDHETLVFRHGYTTKPNKKGFGLHYCANALREMNATIRLESPGIDQGTSAILFFSTS